MVILFGNTCRIKMQELTQIFTETKDNSLNVSEKKIITHIQNTQFVVNFAIHRISPEFQSQTKQV